jgi:hypothetical protein
MNPCGMTRLLLPAFLVGFAVATFVGNDLYGWIAAGLTMGITAVVTKIRGTNQTCAISPPAATDHEVEEPADAGQPDLRPPLT